MQLEVREVAALFGVSDKTVYRWVEEDGLPAHEVEGHHRFHRAEVLEWATTRDLSPSPELFAEVGDAPASTIVSALTRGGIFHEVPARNRREAIASIVERLPISSMDDRGLLAEILLARSGFGKPGGPGIAIPHVRHPIVLDLVDPCVCLFFLATQVDVGAELTREPGGHIVHTVFTLLTPSVRSHLVTLSRLAFVVHDESVRAVLERHGPAAEVLDVIARTEARLHASAGPE
jgi:PTS system nitrogen regulatory IIA component